MIYEERIYTIRPGKLAQYMKNYEELGLPVQMEVIGNLVGFFHTEIGGLNKVVHIWGYENLDERLKKRAELAALLERIEAEKILISCEELFGWFHLNFANNSFIAETLKQLIPEAKLIIVIRAQADWLESAYKQTLRQNSSETINRFLRFRDGGFETSRLLPGRP